MKPVSVTNDILSVNHILLVSRWRRPDSTSCMFWEVQLVPAGDLRVRGAVLIQNIDKTAAHFSEVKPEVGISSMLGSDLHEMEECLVSPWLHEPVWRCFRVSDPGAFQSLNFSHYSTPDLCKGTRVSGEIWFLISAVTAKS